MSKLPDDPQNSGPHTLLPGRPHRWRRVALWSLAVLLAFVCVALIAVTTLLRTPRFHLYVLTKAQQEASQALGVSVELQNFTLQFNGISPTADLYGLTVHGAAPFTATPLLQLPHARIGVRIVSILSRRWYLSEVVIDRPVVQLRVDADGSNNLPRSHGGSSNGVQPLFDLAIHRAQLSGGEVYYNDRPRSLDADLHNLDVNAAFDPARNLYSGQLSYADGHFKSGAYQPIPHALSLNFQMTPTHLDLRNAELHSGKSTVTFTATLDDFTNPRLAAVYRASVDAAELRRVLRNPQLPLGQLQLEGHANYLPTPNQPALQSLALEGTLRSDRIDFALPNIGPNDLRNAQPIPIQLRAIRASYALSNGNAELHSLTASLLSGSLEAHASLRNLTGDQLGAAHLKLNGISLADIKQLTAPTADNNLALAGTVQAVADASWRASLRTLLATADATVDASAASPASQSAVPITGQLHANYRNSDQQLTLRQSFLRTPHTTLTFDGATGRHSQMKLALRADDLHELESIAAIIAPPAQPLDLYGSATFTGSLSGSVSAPHLEGQLNAANLRLHGPAWKLLRAHLDATPSAFDIAGGELSPLPVKGFPQGNITFSGHTALTHWHFTPQAPFQLALLAQRLDAAQLATLAGLTTPVSGTLNAQLQLHGTTLNPIGQGNLLLQRASVAGEPIQSIVASFNGDGDTLHANAKLTLLAGVASTYLTYDPKQRAYQVQLQAHNIQLDRIHAVQSRNLSISGAANLDATGAGTLDDPQLTATLTIPQLHAHEQTIDQLSLQATVARHVATLDLHTRALNSALTAHATVQLAGDFPAEATLDSQPIPLQPIFAAYAPDEASGITGQTELHATLRGPLRHRERIEAHLVVPELNLQYEKSITLALTAPIHADYVNGVLNVQRSGLRGTGTDLQFQGSLPLLDRSKPVALLLLGSVDLRLAQLFYPDVTSSGQLLFNINSYGARSDANLQGAVQIVNANFTLAGVPIGMSNGNGTLALTSDRLNITSFAASMGGGTITAHGGLLFRPSPQFNVLIAGQGIRMLYPEGVREGVSADLTLTGTPAQAILRGQVNVDQLSFAPGFDLSSLTSLSGGGVEEPPSRGFAANLQLNIALRSSQSVNVMSRTMSASGAANLRVTGTAAQPVILGRINLTSGDLLFQGNRYLLQSAVIDFVNPSRTEANVNASVTTTIQQYNIGIRFEGPVDQLRASYSSNPALPPADIINLIAFGKTQEAANATSTTANQTAEQSIASAVSGQVTSRLQKIAGLSYLSVDPTLGNSQQNGATVTVQQRVTSKIFVTYSSDVTSTQPLQQVIQLQYQATPKVSLTGTRDQNGGFAMETSITHDW